MRLLTKLATLVWMLVVYASSRLSGNIVPAEEQATKSLEERLAHTDKILTEVPLIDGHNDLPATLRRFFKNQLAYAPLDKNVSALPQEMSRNMTLHTDWVKMKAGRVGAQFWSAFVACWTQYKNALSMTMDQIDVIHLMIDKYSNVLEFVTTADGILAAHTRGKIASLIGVEGGHSMDSSLANLRSFYREGVRYMSLTHSCNTPWADNSNAENGGPERPLESDGLSPWGEIVVKEMNRIGMFLDLSHVAYQTMDDALRVSRAPVLFTHSNARAICNHTRNVPDDILKRVAQNGGVVMVTFVPSFLNCDGQATLEDAIKHINHIRNVAGVDHVGIGGDYNGIFSVPIGLEDVSKYPYIFAELLKDPKWTDEDLKKLAGTNIIRAFREVERVKDELINEIPWNERIPEKDIDGHKLCVKDWY